MIAWLLAAWAFAAPGAPTLDDVLDSVDRHLPLLQAEAARVEAARGALLGAQGVWDPQIAAGGVWRQGPYDNGYVEVRVTQDTPLYGLSLDAGWRTGLGKFPEYDGWYDTLDRGEAFVDARLPLLKDGWIDQRRADVRIADADLMAAEAKLQEKRVSWALKSREVWWYWNAAGAKLAVSERMLEVAELRQGAVRQRIARGDLAEIDLVDADRVLLERRAAVVKARRDLDTAAFALGLYLRDGTGAPAPPREVRPAPLPTPADDGLDAEDQLLASALAERPDLLAMEQKQRAAETKLRLARVGLLPKLDLKVSLAQDLAGQGETAEPFDVKIGGDLGFTLLQRPARGKALAARGDAEAVDAELRFLRDAVEAEVRSARVAVAAAHERARLADERLALAQRLEEATRRRFDLGDADQFDLYLREQSTLSAAMSRIDAWMTFHLAQASLRAARGLP